MGDDSGDDGELEQGDNNNDDDDINKDDEVQAVAELCVRKLSAKSTTYLYLA